MPIVDTVRVSLFVVIGVAIVGCNSSSNQITPPANPQRLEGPTMSEGGDDTSKSIDGQVKP